MAKTGIGALFKDEPRAAPPTRSPPARPRSRTYPIYANWKDTEKYDNMSPHDNRLQEIVAEPKKRRTQPAPRTGNEDFVMKEETPEKKRKHDEINKMQILHGQPVVDAARAVDMDELHFDEPFAGFEFAANHDNSRWDPYHHDAFNPLNHPANGGRTFYGDTSTYGSSMSQSTNFAPSLSGDTLVPGSYFPGSYSAALPPNHDGAESIVSRSYATARPSHQARAEPFVPEPLYTGGLDPYASASYGATTPTRLGGGQTFVSGSFGSAEPAYPTGDDRTFTPATFAAGSGDLNVADDYHEGFRGGHPQEYSVSATPADDSDFASSESEDERPRKTPKLNKDGVPRKPRQPRAKLLKWSDDDWKNVCLGIVWACGETGVQIPFDQAAQVVGEKCTAGALQQALLKLRGKQVEAGHAIPNLKMAWTRKNKPATPGKAHNSVELEANKPRKKPTRFESTQSFIVTLSRAYIEEHREGLQAPYKWRKPARRFQTNTKAEQHGDYLPATPTNGHQFYESPPVTPFGQNTGFLQGMALGGGEYISLLATEGLHEVGNGWGDAVDDVFGI